MLASKIEGIRVFKFMNGEEVIARCTQLDNGNYSLTSPLRVVVQRAPDGNFAPAFTTWLVTGREEHEVYASQIMVVPYEPPMEFHNEYVRSTSRLDLSTTM